MLDEAGDASDSDDDRGFRPGRGGSGPGPDAGYGRRGAGEYESRRGGGVPEGVEWAESLSRPHMLVAAGVVVNGGRPFSGASPVDTYR